jgi:hypothetical protein
VQGTQVTLHTLPQERGRAYQLRVTSVVHGQDASGNLMQLDPNQQPMLFQGHPTGIVPAPAMVPAVPSVPTSTQAEDVQNVQVSAQQQLNGSYAVQALWQAPATSAMAASYQLYQSLDHGKTFLSARSLPATTNGVRLTGVPAGELMLIIQTAYVDGRLSRGVMQTVNLPGASQQTLPGSVTTPPATVHNGKLPQTGVAAMLPLVTASGAFGWTMVRRKRRARAAEAA